ncbi:MAG: hypothetical protein ACKOXK_10415 [Chakrabartia sp.]
MTLEKGKTLAVLIAFCAALSSAHAENEGMEKFRNWLPSQILSLSKEQRRSEVPIAYLQAANTKDLSVQYSLNVLMYEGFGNFEKAKRQFQIDLGEQSTGQLTVGQLSKLFFRAERTKLTRVYFFPFKFGGEISDEEASVRGTVKILDEKIADPINYVEIQCSKAQGTCSYRQFVLILPNEGSWSQSYTVMETMNETYRVTRWGTEKIDALPLNEGTCRVPELRLNFVSKEFYEIVTNAPEGKCELLLGATLPKLEKPRISQIVDGDPIISEQFAKLQQESYSYLSSDFRTKAQSVFEGPAK